MQRRTSLGTVLFLALLPACSDHAAAADTALVTFARFQAALFARDGNALRSLVTSESAPVVDAMPWDRVCAQQPLVPIDASDERGCCHVHVRDPNQHDAPGTYVVVRENGRFVVDLVATAALQATPTGRRELLPRALTPADRERIRQRELATPPGQPLR